MQRQVFRYGVCGSIASLVLGVIAPLAEASGRIIEVQGDGASIQRQGESRRQQAWVGTENIRY